MSKAKLRADAINRFVVDAKSQGVYDALKASCVMAGWDSLAGALTPLAGTAPSNNGFLAADYDRGTGLKGDGASYLDSGRQASDDPLNDFHLSVHITEASNVSQGMYIAGQATAPNDIYNSAGLLFVRSRGAASTNGGSSSTGFIGHSRAEASAYISRNNSINFTHASSSVAADPQNIFVFARNQSGSVNSIINGRLSWYSIGTSVDLSVLDTLVSRLLADFRSIDEDGMDRDALAYIRNVEAADASYLELGVKKAIDQFVRGCKYDGIWDAIKASCILCGARTLAGALVPLAGAAPTNVNNNFIEEDYNRETGLVGDGATKHLLTGLGYNEVSANDEHLAVYLSVRPGDSQNFIGGGTVSPASYSRIGYSSAQQRYDVQSGVTVSAAGAFSPGLVGVSRSSSTEFSRRQNNTTTISASNSAATRSSTSAQYGVFCANISDNPAAGKTTAGMSFYSIGTAISDLALLDTRVTALVQGVQLGIRTGPVASGGTETVISQGGKFYKVHTFTSTGTSTLTFSRGGEVEYLVVAGAGGGGSIGGGGGAGGFRTEQNVISAGDKDVVVGDGGAGSVSNNPGGDGQSSSFNGLVSAGGGGGGRFGASGADGRPGGSGGGGGSSGQAGLFPLAGIGNTPATSPAQGNDGGRGGQTTTGGGGGGGAGGEGKSSTQTPARGGGVGASSAISGTEVVYAAGGVGGSFGVGEGADGTDGLGNGGAGGRFNNPTYYNGGDGGSGIVVVRYEITEAEYEAV